MFQSPALHIYYMRVPASPVDRSLTYQRSLLAVAGLDALDGELRQLEVGAELDGLAVRVPFQQELPRCLGNCKTSCSMVQWVQKIPLTGRTFLHLILNNSQ